jgi:hypothetical protein
MNNSWDVAERWAAHHDERVQDTRPDVVPRAPARRNDHHPAAPFVVVVVPNARVVLAGDRDELERSAKSATCSTTRMPSAVSNPDGLTHRLRVLLTALVANDVIAFEQLTVNSLRQRHVTLDAIVRLVRAVMTPRNGYQ